MPAHGVGDGRDAHGWVEALASAGGLEIVVGEPLAPHGQRLMDALGVRVVVREGAPTFCECCNPSGRNGKRPPRRTRAELGDDERAAMRERYAARPESMRRRSAATSGRAGA